eukprot:CAMPEP_0197650294 /NCGR_PEP_ID=MMETSP1338-20131121/30855_1 /TAXON_ID=43686 ORGANISM="Pelagodinium beii, Strain RCC1491" /NCGR_SAMPLE_ID=MMETSP1338 /ASSEMBLY_ACC=CAM_ASM_000754 /LENGTH=237 /DNA_ID=CAMNT_0043224667 /DNA_START=109 /DNA_END=820 /DNA_ORIENTATION=+
MEPMTLVSPYFNQHAAAPDEPLYVFPSWLELAAKAPPGLAPPSDASKEDVHSSTNTKKICYFQNRYHHAAPGSSFVACSRGDDCDFCHCFHPKMKRRNDPTESFCNCSSSSSTASTEDGASESTAIETGADTSDDSSSVSSGSDDSPGLSLPPDVPTPTVVRVREGRQSATSKIASTTRSLGRRLTRAAKVTNAVAAMRCTHALQGGMTKPAAATAQHERWYTWHAVYLTVRRIPNS